MRLLLLLSVVAPLLSACTMSNFAARIMRHDNVSGSELSDRTRDSLYLGAIEGLIRQGRYQAALAFLDEYKGPSARAQILRGSALVGAGYPQEAIAAYEKAIGSAYSAAAYSGMGRAESAKGDWAVAVEDFRRASAIEPANAEYLNNLGYARLNLGAGSAAAEEDLSRALELDPQSEVIRNNLILAARISNDQSKLTVLLDSITDAKKRETVAQFAQGWSAGQTPDTKEEVR